MPGPSPDADHPLSALPPDDAAGGAGRKARIGQVGGVLVFLAILLLPAPAGMPLPAWRVTALASLMAIWWTTEAIPIPATALLPILLVPALGIRPVEFAAAPYANPVIFLFLGGFLLAIAIERSALHRRLALTIIHAAGAGPDRLVAGFMAGTASLSMWVSNAATVAMMLPMAVSILILVAESGAPEEPGHGPAAAALAPALLLGLAYSASIGGLGTLIGSPPNALLAGFMREAYGIEVGFGAWMLIGLPIVLVGLPIVWFVLTRLLFRVGSVPIAGGREAIGRQLQALGGMSRAEWTAGIVAVIAAAAWVVRPALERVVPGLSDAGIAIGAALLLFLIPSGRGGAAVLDWRAAETVPWGVLLLFGGGLSLAAAIQDTGLASWIGTAMEGIGRWPTLLVVVAVTSVIVFLTEITSNTATAAAFLPVVGSLAVAIGQDPLLLAIPTALGASCAFMLPVATPPNAIVYGSGQVALRDMIRAGIWLNVIFVAVITVAAIWWVPVVFGR